MGASRSARSRPRTAIAGGSKERISRSGAVTGAVGMARSRAGLNPGDQKSSRHSADGRPVTLITGPGGSGCPALIPAPRGEQLLPAPPTAGQHGEWIVVERLGQDVADR